jgi:hypothetical protein
LHSTAASSATSAESSANSLTVVAPPVVYSATAATGRVLRGRQVFFYLVLSFATLRLRLNFLCGAAFRSPQPSRVR